MNQQCKVCGEPAAGFHFGAFTCEGCKVRPTMLYIYLFVCVNQSILSSRHSYFYFLQSSAFDNLHILAYRLESIYGRYCDEMR